MDSPAGPEEEEAATWGLHGAETAGWLALDMGAATDADGLVFEAGALRANHNAAEAAPGAPLGLVAGAASFEGPAAARNGDVGADGFSVHIEEDLPLNQGLPHRAEDIRWPAWTGAGETWSDAVV